MRSREEKEGGKGKREKEKIVYISEKKRKTERRRNGIGAGLPHFIVLHRDLVAGEQNPVSVGNSGGRHATGLVHA